MSALHLLWLIPIASMLTASAAPLWRFSNPKPHGNNILDLGLDASGNYWEIGDRGRLYISPDLDTWFPQETGTTRSLRSLIFFKNSAVISTEAGGILAGPSADALSFVDLGTSDWLE